jgi:hypothetical protein
VGFGRHHPLWHAFNTEPFKGSARLSIAVAKDAPVALVVRRQPSTLWTVFRWELSTNELTEGGSFEAIFWAAGCDISWDGLSPKGWPTRSMSPNEPGSPHTVKVKSVA